MLKVEFHCHSNFSPDSFNRIEAMLARCRQLGIDRIAITDHNTSRGAFLAKSIDPELVIVGEEVKTLQGELLAYYIQEEIPAGLSAHDTIKLLKDQNAFISVSHPFDPYRGWQLVDLLDVAPMLDGMEIFNARCFRSQWNEKAARFASEHQLLAMAGSDAHTLNELGRASMLLAEFDSAAGLKAALTEASFDCRLSGPWVRVASRTANTISQLKKIFS